MNENQIERFWAEMAQIYGKGWYDNNGSSPPDLWRRELRRMNPQRVAATLEACKNFGDRYPINFSQFCGRYRELERHNKNPMHQPFKSLAAPQMTEEQVESYKRQTRAVGAICRSTLGAPKRRVVTRPGFSFEDAQAEISRLVRDEGVTRHQAQLKLMEANGWTAEDEKRLAEAGGAVYRRAMNTGK